MARVSEGLELVRVGNPQRPEMAAWRYGDQFGKRRRRYYMIAGGSAIAVGALLSGYAALGLFAGSGVTLANSTTALFSAIRSRRVVARVPTPEGLVNVTRALLPRAKIVRFAESDWRLSLQYLSKPARGAYKWWEFQPGRFTEKRITLTLEPEAALPALALLLPTVNGRGGTRRHVQTAVGLVEQTGDAKQMLDTAASLAAKKNWNPTMQGRLSTIPIEARLALEMMTHEDDERRALEGDLAVLEERWKEAEEIAGISDNMFLPAAVTDWMSRMRYMMCERATLNGVAVYHTIPEPTIRPSSYTCNLCTQPASSVIAILARTK